MNARNYTADDVENALALLNQEETQTPKKGGNYTELAKHLKAVQERMKNKGEQEVNAEELTEDQRAVLEQYVEPTTKSNS